MGDYVLPVILRLFRPLVSSPPLFSLSSVLSVQSRMHWELIFRQLNRTDSTDVTASAYRAALELTPPSLTSVYFP